MTLLLMISATFAVTAGCSKKAPAGYEPVFRKEFSGAGCKALKVETGTYDKVCTKPPGQEVCLPQWSVFKGDVAIVHGQYEGPICLRGRDECGPREKVEIAGASAHLDEGSLWMVPQGAIVAGERTIDVRATLLAGCSPEAQEQTRQRVSAEADLEKIDFQSLTAWTADVHRQRWLSVGGKIDSKDVSRCPGLEAVQPATGDDEFEAKRKERERERWFCSQGVFGAARRKSRSALLRYSFASTSSGSSMPSIVQVP